MADLKVITGGATKAKTKVGPAAKAAIVLFVIETLGAFLFQGLWILLALPRVVDLLYAAQLPNLAVTIGQIFVVNSLPLVLTILAVLAPLFGWWIYSRFPVDKHNSTGWALAGTFTAIHVTLGLALGLFSAMPYDAISWIGYAFGAVMAYVTILLWVMFFMGVGFLVAKLFKAQL